MIGRNNDRDRIMPGDPGYTAMLFCRFLTIAAIVLGGGLLASVWQSQVLVALVALLPVLAVGGAFATGGEITLGGKAGTIDTRPTAVWALWLPALALALHAYWDGMNLQQPQDVLWAGAIGGIALMMFILLADPIVRYSLPRTVPLMVPAFLYAAGLAGPVDMAADWSAPIATTTAQVIARTATTGHGASPVLELSTWGPVTKLSEAHVSRAVYDRAAVGEQVCVSLHGGALAMKWYDVALCQ